MSRIEIPLYYCKSRVPLVVFWLDDEKYIGIVDTGSEVSMFDFSLKGSGMSEVNQNVGTSFVGVNGPGGESQVSQVEGELAFKNIHGNYITVGANGVLYDFVGLTSVFRNRTKKNISISAILGCDFLKEHEAKIDLKRKKMTITV